MARRTWYPLAVAVTLLSSCGFFSQDPDIPPSPVDATLVEVDNQNFQDMRVYVYDGSQRVRLGIASGNTTTRLKLPKWMVRGMVPVQFMCDPVGGRGAQQSDEVVLQPGDRVTLLVGSTIRNASSSRSSCSVAMRSAGPSSAFR